MLAEISALTIWPLTSWIATKQLFAWPGNVDVQPGHVLLPDDSEASIVSARLTFPPPRTRVKLPLLVFYDVAIDVDGAARNRRISNVEAAAESK